MIKQQIKSFFNGFRQLICIITLILVCFLWVVYKENKDTENDKGSVKCIEWAIMQNDPIGAVKEAQSNLFLNINKSEYSFSNNLYNEYMVLLETQEYLEQTYNYRENIQQVYNNIKIMNQFGLLTQWQQKKNNIELEYYEKCLNNTNVEAGNYKSAEKFFSFDAIDVFIIILLFFICYSLVVEEREKGISSLIYTTKNGGWRYFFLKLTACLFIAWFFILIMYLMKYCIYTSIYGNFDWSVSIQSMKGYFSAPWNISIAKYLLFFILWKIVGYSILLTIILLICSMKLSNVACSVASAFLVVGLILFKTLISDSSTLVFLRDISLFQVLDTEYWFSALRIYNVLDSQSSPFVLTAFQTPVISALLVGVLAVIIGILVYNRRLKSSKENKKSRHHIWMCKYNKPFVNEVYYVFLHKRVLLFIVALISIYSLFICDFKNNVAEETKLEGQVVSFLNKMSIEDSKEWLNDKNNEFNELSDNIVEKQREYENGLISEMALSNYISFVSSQLVLQPIVEECLEQSTRIESDIEKYGSDVGFEYTALSSQVLGREGQEGRSWQVLIVSSVLIFLLMSLLPNEKEHGIFSLLSSSINGKKVIIYRCVLMLFSVVCTAISCCLIWLYSLKCQYGFIGVDINAHSWNALGSTVVNNTVLAVIMIEVLGQAMKWIIICLLAIIISLMFNKVIVSEIIGIIVFALPAMISIIGVEIEKVLPYYKLMSFGGNICTSSVTMILGIVGTIIIGFFVLNKGIKKWIKLL